MQRRRRVKVHFREEETVLPVELCAADQEVNQATKAKPKRHRKLNRDCGPLFWFGSRSLLLHLFSMTVTWSTVSLLLLFYGIVMDKSTFVDLEGVALVTCAVLFNLGAIVYAATYLQPLVALVSAVSFSMR